MGATTLDERDTCSGEAVFEDQLRTIRSAFLELPTLALTLRQASRLWHLDTASCATLLTALMADGFLDRTEDGRYRLRRC